jgi:gamma-glutamylcysteine synthetase
VELQELVASGKQLGSIQLLLLLLLLLWQLLQEAAHKQLQLYCQLQPNFARNNRMLLLLLPASPPCDAWYQAAL